MNLDNASAAQSPAAPPPMMSTCLMFDFGTASPVGVRTALSVAGGCETVSALASNLILYLTSARSVNRTSSPLITLHKRILWPYRARWKKNDFTTMNAIILPRQLCFPLLLF